ncbi:hypothetical protein Csa_021789 [Cucumis sativus]|nr:hypothetical protein Csa_021789 [Cucumis sativus]
MEVVVHHRSFENVRLAGATPNVPSLQVLLCHVSLRQKSLPHVLSR